ncbi:MULTISPECIES: hypothetical protein [Alphaproteobacteria]|uniref:hypothetical protein n=1 Tax=Alphaproteobacteria TaxID=28211 RepID=UPI003A8D51E9
MSANDESFSYKLTPAKLDDAEGAEILAALGRATHSFSQSETWLLFLAGALMVTHLAPNEDGTASSISDLEAAVALMAALDSNRAKRDVLKSLVCARIDPESDICKRVVDHLDKLRRLTNRRNDMTHQAIFEIQAPGLKPAKVWGKPELLDRSLMKGDDESVRKAVRAFINNNKPRPKQILEHADHLDQWGEASRLLAKEVNVALATKALRDREKQA